MRTIWTEYRGVYIALVGNVVIGHIFKAVDSTDKKTTHVWQAGSYFVSHTGARTHGESFKTLRGAQRWINSRAKSAKKNGLTNVVAYDIHKMEELIDRWYNHRGEG